MLKPLLTALVLLFAARPVLADGDIAKETLTFRSHERTYYVYAPAATAPVPLIVLLHGTGGNGLFMASRWIDVAKKEGIALVAPDSLHSEVGWGIDVDGPDYIRAVLTKIAAEHPIDARRVYLFGQSGGAVHALRLGMLESQFFAAVAVHAGAWRHTAEYGVTDFAKRKIPVSISVGDKDEYFSMIAVNDTQRVLAARGFPIEVNVLKDRVHSYMDVPADFNAGVWDFLRRNPLQGDPQYIDYYYSPPMR
jgi:poly(3-hydroxybutyrate) depolymerase